MYVSFVFKVLHNFSTFVPKTAIKFTANQQKQHAIPKVANFMLQLQYTGIKMLFISYVLMKFLSLFR